MSHTLSLDCRPPRVSSDLRIGIIGAGGIVHDAHLPAYRMGGLRVSGITDLRREAAEELARGFEIPRVFANGQELIESDEVDLVDIAIPEQGREELVTLAARAGKPVLIQKPLSEDLAVAQRMAATARAAGIKLAVNQNARWAPEFRAARSAVEQGLLGQLYRVRWEMRNNCDDQPWARDSWNAQVPRWQILIWSIHHLDLIRFWTGQTPDRVYCSLPRKPGQNFVGEVMASVVLDFDSGVHATMIDDNASIPNREVIQEFGLEGTEGLCEGRVSSPRHFELRLKAEPDHVYRPDLEGEWYPSGFLGAMCDLLQAVAEDRQPSVSGEDNLRTLALVEACYRSAAEGRVVDPREILAFD